MSFDHLRSREHTKYEMVFSSELTRKMKRIRHFLFDVMIQEIYSRTFPCCIELGKILQTFKILDILSVKLLNKV